MAAAMPEVAWRFAGNLVEHRTRLGYTQEVLAFRACLHPTTLSVERLVAELARYGQLYRAREKQGGAPLWSSYYRSFPPVICALTGASRKSLSRRLDVARGLLADDPALDRAYDVAIYFCLLDDLVDCGPFAPIFHAVGGDRAVDWIGEAGRSRTGDRGGAE